MMFCFLIEALKKWLVFLTDVCEMAESDEK